MVQRVRTAGSELVEDQEIYRRISVTPGSGRFVGDVLLQSRLVRMLGEAPAQRPNRSAGGPGGGGGGGGGSGGDVELDAASPIAGTNWVRVSSVP